MDSDPVAYPVSSSDEHRRDGSESGSQPSINYVWTASVQSLERDVFMMDLDQPECAANMRTEQWCLNDGSGKASQFTSWDMSAQAFVQPHHGQVCVRLSEFSHTLVELPD